MGGEKIIERLKKMWVDFLNLLSILTARSKVVWQNGLLIPDLRVWFNMIY